MYCLIDQSYETLTKWNVCYWAYGELVDELSLLYKLDASMFLRFCEKYVTGYIFIFKEEAQNINLKIILQK